MRRLSSTDLMLLTPPLMWSLHIVGTRYALTGGFTPLAYLLFRAGIGAMLFTLLVLWIDRSLRIDGRRNQILVVLAAVTMAVNQIAFSYALDVSTAVTVSLMFGIFPITVALLAAMIGIERLTARMVVLGAVSFAGVALVVLGVEGGVSSLSGQLDGILLALAVPLTWSIFSVLISKPVRTQSPLRINAITLWGAAIGGFVAGGWTIGDVDFGAIKGLVWASVVYSTIGALIVGNIIWFRALRRVGPARSSFYLNLQPFGAAVLAVLLLGEHISWLQILGGVVIGAAILLSRRRAPEPAA
ncbi:MAG: DMT family transporter [Actinobacteria bacterium]|nr:DMT family transporter [Actinomycetota bacterium]